MSSIPRPAPPNFSGTMSPVHPSLAISRYRSGSEPSSLAIALRTAVVGHSPVSNSRALSFSCCCSSLSPKSISFCLLLLRRALFRHPEPVRLRSGQVPRRISCHVEHRWNEILLYADSAQNDGQRFSSPRDWRPQHPLPALARLGHFQAALGDDVLLDVRSAAADDESQR